MTHAPTLPGTGADLAGMLRMKAAAPLKPKAPPIGCDFGLFADHTPLDLVELARKPGANDPADYHGA